MIATLRYGQLMVEPVDGEIERTAEGFNNF
jgi:hypothetical protein